MEKEFRLDLKIRNNLILKKIEENGYKTVGEFCRINNIQPSELGEVVNMKVNPMTPNGKWKKVILKCSEIFFCSPDDFFTKNQLNIILKDNKKSIQINEAEIKFLSQSKLNDNKSLEDIVLLDQRNNKINEILEKCCNERHRKVIKMRFGLDGERESTLVEIGKTLNLTQERIRQMVEKSLRRLRGPSIANDLRDFIE